MVINVTNINKMSKKKHVQPLVSIILEVYHSHMHRKTWKCIQYVVEQFWHIPSFYLLQNNYPPLEFRAKPQIYTKKKRFNQF